MPPSSSVTRTIRIERDVDDFLRKFGDREGVSVNLLVNKAIRRLVEWDIFAEKFGLVALPSSLIERMMDRLTDEEAGDLGRWVGRNLIPEFITFWFKEVNLQAMVIGYPRLQSRYGRAFEYEEHVEAGKWTIILKHSAGAKWSVYYEGLLKTAFQNLLQTDLAIEKTDNQVVARFTIK
ncbi:MAG: hypothetical protein E6K02_00850 [Methanobacteriota archaeon]|nr:MAG: hypothetical protein E6K02_00850 [Euryarchaeota archaeon]HYT18579.1 hypothetical protein [Thermoplasmata archaeon]